MQQTRTLRIIQICFIAYVLLLFWLIRILRPTEPHNALTPLDWAIVAVALASATASFIIPNLIIRAAANPEIAAKSTPIKRWMAIGLLRMAFAVSVAIYGLVLHTTGCPDKVVIVLIALGLILLLFNGPGQQPAENQQINP